MKHVSYKGQHIDMDLLRFKNQHQIALGNAQMNSRGDKLGKGGVIIKTREQLLQERENLLTKPDYNPEQAYTTKMEPLDPFEKKAPVQPSTDDFTGDAESASFEEFNEEPVQKRTPKKK